VGSKCEGMVRLRDLDDDFYFLDEENYQVIGQRYGHQYKLGDQVKVKVKRIDLSRKEMDFQMVSETAGIKPQRSNFTQNPKKNYTKGRKKGR